VIENEFGEGLQVESLIARDGVSDENLADLIELPNGCICCTVKDSLVATLELLVEKRADLDYILIECSGMANPGPIAALFWLDDALESRLRLDGIVTVVDAANIERQLKETVEAAQQIAYADRVLLNKVDLIRDTTDATDTSSLDRLTGIIRSIHATVPVRPTTYSAVPDLDWILEAECFDADRARQVDETLHKDNLDNTHDSTHNSSNSHDHDHDHDHDHNHEGDCQHCVPEHVHTSAISTVALVLDGTVDWNKVNAWLANILWPNQDEQERVLRARLEQGNDDNIDDDTTNRNKALAAAVDDTTQRLFRIKGVLSVRNALDSDGFVDEDGVDTRRFIVQAVHDTWEIHPASQQLAWTEQEVRQNKVVVIGRYLQEDELRAGLNNCLI
jgi:G3E family GTPase